MPTMNLSGTSTSNFSLIKKRKPGTAITSTMSILNPANPALAAAPNAPTPPTPAVQPPDPIYEGKKANLDRAYGDTTASLDYDEGRIKQDYGIDDASNPFSRQKLLNETYQNRQRGTTNTLAARGQLYSGAIQNQRGIDQHGFDISSDQLHRGYDDALAQVAERRRNAKTAYESGNVDALGESTQRALDNRPDPASLASPAAEAGPAAPLTRAQTRRRARLAQGISLKKKPNAKTAARLRAQGLL